MYGQVYFSLAHRSRDHTIIKTHEGGSEDPFQDSYVIQKTQTRRRVKATHHNETRVGRMFSPSLPGENANTQGVSTDNMGNRDKTQDGR